MIKIANGTALLKGLELLQPDILLLDIHMPGQQGDELAGIVTATYPAVKIIALTSFDHIFHIKNMLKNGVRGYLLKDIERELFFEAIYTVFEGGIYLAPRVKKLIAENEQILQRQLATGSKLTKREQQILQLIARNNTSAEIAEILFLSKRTVEHHRESIFSKLEVKKTSSLVKKALELGLINP